MNTTYYQNNDTGAVIRFNGAGDFEIYRANEKRWELLPPDKVLFVITTDGMENASREYSYGRIKSMIEKQESKHKWEFIFLGANIDAVDVASRFGIAKNRAQTFHNDRDGIELNYEVRSQTVSAFRADVSEARIADDWSKDINKDFV